MKKLVILGSTGSIGNSTLRIAGAFPRRLRVVALAAGNNMSRLKEQIDMFRPEAVAVADHGSASRLRTLLGRRRVRILEGEKGICEVAAWPGADQVVSAMSGSAGLLPTMTAIRAGHDVALANKETMVMAGPLVTEAARRSGAEIFPVDSEHSAIYQALEGKRRQDVSSIILTASGGPFLHMAKSAMSRVTPAQALKHPRWTMGAKISIDSATMMNKGLEIIEARWLFHIPQERIRVVIHPESIVHSLVEFADGSMFAHLGVPDMRGPISYALFHPERVPVGLASLDLPSVGRLTFLEPDGELFPALRLARQALARGGTMPAVLNAANETAVEAFLAGDIGFLRIADVVKKVMESHRVRPLTSLDVVADATQWGKRTAWDHCQ